MALFENYERRIDKINGVLAQYGISSVEECRELCQSKGFDPYEIVKGIQPICFENACWAYTVGAAIALKAGVKSAAEAAKMIGVGLQSFCIDGSVAEDRKVGLGHGNLGAMLLSDESKCFAFLAGHESFAAAEGAIGIVKNANKARKEPLRVILNGLGKDAAQIISRINGFTYVQTQFDYFTGKLNVVREIRYSEGERANVRCYGADDVREGVAIMHAEGVDVSITGNSTNPTRFQHPVAGTYKKECIEQGKKYFSVASGGGTGRTLHPDNMAAGPASYGMTDTMGRMHSDAQFAGSSSVPAHVEMMGFLGMEELPARHEEVEHAEEEGIIFKTLTNPVKINGNENGYVASMTCVEMELGEPDASGRRRPIEKVGSDFDLPVDCVIMSLGTTPNPLIKNTTPGLEVNRKGGIVVNEEGLTSHASVYAGGDAVTGAATVILAMGAGKLGAKSIDEQLSKK